MSTISQYKKDKLKYIKRNKRPTHNNKINENKSATKTETK